MTLSLLLGRLGRLWLRLDCRLGLRARLLGGLFLGLGSAPIRDRIMERFGVPKNIVAFVLPTGYSFNLDGSTLYLAVASVFAAFGYIPPTAGALLQEGIASFKAAPGG